MENTNGNDHDNIIDSRCMEMEIYKTIEIDYTECVINIKT